MSRVRGEGGEGGGRDGGGKEGGRRKGEWGGREKSYDSLHCEFMMHIIKEYDIQCSQRNMILQGNFESLPKIHQLYIWWIFILLKIIQ